MTLFQTFLLILAVLLALFGLGMLGLALPPRRFRAHPVPSQMSEKEAIPADLPEPVRRHFAATLGDPAPRIATAVVWGRAQLHMRGVWLPARFKIWFRSGESFYRLFEMTWFRRPILRGYDEYHNGKGVFAISGEVERGPAIDQSQYLAMWAQSVWLPSVFVHHPGAQWQPIDEVSARLVIPFANGTDELMAHFDPTNGCMTHLSALRYRTSEDEKELWRVDLMEWKRFEGLLIPSKIAMTWGETVSPWAYWDIDGVAYNVNVAEKLGETASN